MVIILRFRVYIEAIDRLLVLPVLQNGLLLLSQVTLHLYLLVQFADRGLGYAPIRHELLHFSLDVAQELLAKCC